MTIHRIEGFEQGDLSAFSGTTGTCSISSTTVDTGVYSFRCNPTTTGTGFGWLTGFTSGGEIFTSGTTTTVNPMYIKFDFRYATKPSADSEEILMISDSGATRMASLRLDSAGKLSLYRKDGTTQHVLGSTVLSADTWYRLELYLKKETADVSNNGEYELKIDGTSEFSGTTLDCGAGNVSRVYLGKHTNRNGRSVDLFYDNVIIRDDTWPGAAKVKRMAIDGNGNYTGATSGTYTDADEIPHNSDTDYLTWTSNTNKHSFSLESSSSAGISGTIHCIQTFAISRDTAGGGPTHQIFIREGATDTNIGSGGNPSTTYIFEGGGVKETVPSDSGAWATSDLDGLEVGFYAATSVAQAQRLTSIGVQVAYTPSSGYTLTADAGSYTLSGQTAGLLFGRKVTAGAGSFTLTGQNAGLLRAYPMPAAAGSFVLTGQTAGLLATRTLSIGAGSFSLTGQTAGLYRNYPMVAGAGSFTLTGQNAGLIAARTVGAGAASFVLSGQAAGLLGGFRVTAGTGAFVLSGQDVTLIGPAGDYTLTADAGSFTLSGQAANLLAARDVNAGTGSFTLTGQSASLLFGRRLNAGDLTDGLIACYRFDGDLVDSSGQGNDLSGLSQYTTGKLGQGLTGINTVDKPLFSGFQSTARDQRFTVSFWVKTSTADGLGPYLYMSTLSNPLLTIEFVYQDGTQHTVSLSYDGVSLSFPGNDFLQIGEWTQLTLVHEGSGSFSLYRNGELFDNPSRSVPSTTELQTNVHLDVLAYRDDIAVFDQLMFWNRRLGETDVRALYAAGNGLDPTTTSTSAYVVTGQAASLLVGRDVVAGAGSFAVSGRDASLLTYRVISAVYGSYVLTGNGVAYDASLGGLVCSFVSVSARVFGDVSIGSFVSGDSLLSPSTLGVVSVEEC